MELTECINFQLSSVQSAVFNRFKAKLAPLGVTPPQYALLKCLWTEDGQKPTQLAQTLHLDTSSITGALDRLEKKQLIERVYDARDRRGIYVYLLEKGAALQAPVETAILEANREVTAGISPAELEVLVRQLRIIEENAAPK